MRSTNVARGALAVLLLAAASIGLFAALAPHAFYEDFPLVRHWVELLPPYNEHLVSDVGGLYLGFVVLFAWAAWTLQPTLVRAACAAWLLTQALHFTFHVAHLGPYEIGDAIAQLASLALLMVPAALAIWAVGDRGAASSPPARGDLDRHRI